MLRYSQKYSTGRGSTWKLAILMIAATTGTFLLLTSVTDSLLQNQVNLEKYNLGYVTLFSGTNPPIILDPGEIAEKAKTVYIFTDTNVTNLSANSSFSNVFKITVARVHQTINSEPLIIGLVGINSEAEAHGSLPYANIWSGSFINPDPKNGVVINTKLAEKTGLKEGSSLDLVILGETHQFQVQGVYGPLLSRELDPEYAIVLDQSLFWRVFKGAEHRYNGLLVQLNDPGTSHQAVEWLNKEFSNAYVVYQYTRAEHSVGLIDSTRRTYNLLNAILLILSSVIFVAVRVFDMYKRKREIGLFLTIGWREKDIVSHIFVQTTVLATIGLVLGIGLVFLVGKPLTTVLIPAELRVRSLVNLTVPNLRFIPNTIYLCLVLSALGISAVYLYLRKLSPMKLLEEK